MLIAGIDLATADGSVAIRDARRGVAAEKTFLCGNDQSARVLPALEELLKKNSVSLFDVKAFAVTSGPGSFTGLRVALAVVRGLCYGKNIPVITVGTLYATALFVYQSALADKSEKRENTLICPVLDAYKGDVYSALYEFRGGGETKEIIAPSDFKPNELTDILNADSDLSDKSEIIFAGAGWGRIKSFISPKNRDWRRARARKMPLALVCAKEADARIASGEKIPEPTLHYIKPPDIQMPKVRI